MATLKAAIFDLGGVLLPNVSKILRDLETHENLQQGSLVSTLQKTASLFESLEKGEITLEDFQLIFDHFYSRKYGKRSPKSIFGSMIDCEADERMVTAACCVRQLGIKTALLTNNFWLDRAKLRETIPLKTSFGPLRNLFDVVVESCRVGIRKPDTRIYELTFEKLKVSPNDCVFLDDMGTNLKSARALGVRTIQVKSVEEAIVELEKLINRPLRNYVPRAVPLSNDDKFSYEAIAAFLHKQFSLSECKLSVLKFTNGQSNPTYYVNCGEREFVLRKKPSGSLLHSAHMIEREYRVLNAIQGSVPVPKPILFNENVMDTPFYLMDYLKGRIFSSSIPEELRPHERRAMYDEARRTLVKIHSIDLQESGLHDFGSKGNYLERNLALWHNQYKATATEDILEMEELFMWLSKNLPQSRKSTLVHGDYRIGNLLYHPTNNELIAVLDWETATIGDPLSDMATFLFPHYVTQALPLLQGIGMCTDEELVERGIPTAREFLEAYLRETNSPTLSDLEWTFYCAFIAFRFASILQGVWKRYVQGQASSPSAAQLGGLPRSLARVGIDIIGEHDHSRISDAYVPFRPQMLHPSTYQLYLRLKEFIETEIIEKESSLLKYANSEAAWTPNRQIEDLKQKAKQQGLWNLFITKHVDENQQYGKGLLNVEYSHFCELMGRSIFAAEVFNCSAPDTGNMEVLMKYGSEKQKQQWLVPLLEGSIRSCFAMTEPDVASSDATNIQGVIVRDGEEYVINSRKWFITGAAHPLCRLCIFMGRVIQQKEQEDRHRQHTMILVPMESEGISIERRLDVIGMEDPPGGHCEITFCNVRVPQENVILGEGRGFEIAQGRLGPGRVHHCMRLVGHAERALQLMKQRVKERRAFGKQIADFDDTKVAIANSRIDIDQARLLVLSAAQKIDAEGPRRAAKEIAMIKVCVPKAVYRVVDRAIQSFGAAGLISDSPLPAFLVAARSLRIADGPDEVHMKAIAKRELLSNSKL